MGGLEDGAEGTLFCGSKLGCGEVRGGQEHGHQLQSWRDGFDSSYGGSDGRFLMAPLCNGSLYSTVHCHPLRMLSSPYHNLVSI